MTFRFVVPDAWFEAAREHLRASEGVRDPSCGMEVDPNDDGTVELETESGTEYFRSESCKTAYAESQRQSDATVC
ncbi:hypothetical protein ACFR97_06620 [Haloplanus litoreus]|uniref:YHS domain-containing protein n=1 Tax=Haloplanus litoreus TaxID=767515 RepID=A0ABD5ZZH9_9EURY